MGVVLCGVYENCVVKYSIFVNVCLVFDMGCGIISLYVILVKNYRYNLNFRRIEIMLLVFMINMLNKVFEGKYVVG